MLIDTLPKKVDIDGRSFDINYDFRTSILFEIMIQDDEVDDTTKYINALNLYYPIIPQNKEKAIEKILWFYKGGRKSDVYKKGDRCAFTSDLIYSYDYDDEYIYASFLDQYGVDLQESDMHWWKFRAMFKSLKKDNEFVKIMGYRAMNISNKMTKEEQQFYRNMKRLHEIPKSKKEIKEISNIEKALLGDGDLSKVI